jgi:mRNA-degrading endonuclease toxin of MazEF toxin-antitoxin module
MLQKFRGSSLSHFPRIASRPPPNKLLKAAGGTAIISASPDGPPTDTVALAFQMRAIPKAALDTRIRPLTDTELAELELATDEALGRVEPD